MASMATTTKKLRLQRGDRKVLESWLRSRTLPRRQVERAKILLGASRGESSRGIAASLGIARDTARLWMRRYEAEGLEAIQRDRPRSGRPRSITREVEEAIVRKTVEEDPPPEVSTHWSSRLLGEALGIDHVTIWRVWRKYGLKPHQIRRFKLSRDPRLVEKLTDVVGVYMNPPDNAVVFSFDEKSQIQALDRTQPGLPLKKGRAGTMTHDYKRYGTTTLSAALNVATGHVIHEGMPRHRHQEFLKFIKIVEHSVDPDLEIHVIPRSRQSPLARSWSALDTSRRTADLSFMPRSVIPAGRVSLCTYRDARCSCWPRSLWRLAPARVREGTTGLVETPTCSRPPKWPT